MVFRALRKEAVELNLMCRTESTNPDLRQKRSYSVCVCMGMRGGGVAERPALAFQSYSESMWRTQDLAWVPL